MSDILSEEEFEGEIEFVPMNYWERMARNSIVRAHDRAFRAQLSAKDADYQDALDEIGRLRAEIGRLRARILRRAGYFKWGHDSWIHESDEGTVLTTAEAMAALTGPDPKAEGQLAAKDDAIWSLTQTINAMDAYNQMERATDAEIGRLREALGKAADLLETLRRVPSGAVDAPTLSIRNLANGLAVILRAALAGPDPGTTDWPAFAKDYLSGDRERMLSHLPPELRPDPEGSGGASDG